VLSVSMFWMINQIACPMGGENYMNILTHNIV
jgi:hypothetical protein